MDYKFTSIILLKYQIRYFQCKKCGLLQTEEPYWLDEAYNNAISDTDTGLVQRNISISTKLAALLYFKFDPMSAFVDIAGGYGMLVRLMRDLGFNFYWHDKYCHNLLAKGFEAENTSLSFQALTAIEVLEHIYNPIEFISNSLNKFNSNTLIFTTELYNQKLPELNWWYYSFNTGQHISFYQKSTIQHIANTLGLSFQSENGIHILTDRHINPASYRILTGQISRALILYIRLHMKPLTQKDHQTLIKSLNP